MKNKLYFLMLFVVGALGYFRTYSINPQISAAMLIGAVVAGTAVAYLGMYSRGKKLHPVASLWVFVALTGCTMLAAYSVVTRNLEAGILSIGTLVIFLSHLTSEIDAASQVFAAIEEKPEMSEAAAALTEEEEPAPSALDLALDPEHEPVGIVRDITRGW